MLIARDLEAFPHDRQHFGLLDRVHAMAGFEVEVKFKHISRPAPHPLGDIQDLLARLDPPETARGARTRVSALVPLPVPLAASPERAERAGAWPPGQPLPGQPPPVPDSNSVDISVTDAEFSDGMRFARAGWPGTHSPWRGCLAMSGNAREMALRRSSPARLPRTALVYRWRRGGRPGCLQEPRSLCAGTMGTGQGRPRGNGKCLALVPRRIERVRDDHSDSPSRSYDGRADGCRRVR